MIIYCMVQNIQGSKLSRFDHLINICKKLLRFHQKLPYPCSPKACIKKFAEKHLRNNHKTANVLSLECFALYSTIATSFNKSSSIYFLSTQHSSPKLILEAVVYLVRAFIQANTANIHVYISPTHLPMGSP